MNTVSFADTSEIEDESRKLLLLADDLKKEFDSFFERLSDVPKRSNEWVGGKAELYFKIAANEKSQYDRLVERIKEIGYELKVESRRLDDIIYKNNRDRVDD